MILHMNQVLTMLGKKSQLLHTGRAASVVHGCPSTAVLVVRVCIVIEQELDDHCVTCLGSQMEGCPQKFVSSINFRTLVKKEFTHLYLTLTCC